MPLATPEQVRALLLGGQVPRFIQDSPILPDVWVLYARRPAAAADLLLTANSAADAFALAAEVRHALDAYRREHAPAHRRDELPSAAPLAGVVAVRAYMDELFAVLLPMTTWFQDLALRKVWSANFSASNLEAAVERLRSRKPAEIKAGPEPEFSRDLVWLVSMVGAFLAAPNRKPDDPSLTWPPSPRASVDAFTRQMKTEVSGFRYVAPGRQVWRVSLNRTAQPATSRSVLAIKGDAALAVFNVKCEHITWAVLDCGIDASHPAFNGGGVCRVVRTVDFTIARDLLDPARLQQLLTEMADERESGGPDGSLAQALFHRLKSYLKSQQPQAAPEPTFDDVAQYMLATRKRLETGLPVDMGMLEPFLLVADPVAPQLGHGTHVAGIIGGDWQDVSGAQKLRGVCPDIRLMDLRVLPGDSVDGTGSEFAVIAALQYIRYLNDRSNKKVVQGANLSLFTHHDVRNNACGATPVCLACDELVASGVVVVAAAGNGGLKVESRDDGSETFGYLAISITDPGNAADVITVGSAHKERPYQYGVSYFSSRGPTGDGRLKPDLVAPGERITSALPGSALGVRDGTSQATAHVSGAAALLLGRYEEFIGKPARVKQILMTEAICLGRDRYFQGAGMVDTLSALQSI